MVPQLATKTYTVDEYLELEIASDIRNEYRNGEILPMTGGTPNHNDISGNLLSIIKTSLRSKPFRVFHVDQRLWIPNVKIHTYPDVTVAPKLLEMQDGRKDTITNPCFIAEVLSKSTQNYDRSEKFAAYRTINTFEEYLLIDQYHVHVEHHVKTAVNQWLFSEYDDPTVTISLKFADLQIQIADLYDNIDFE
ncbi:Uma2 family endonuclease [Pseudanabaena sp. FACHB-1998]|uniref:Uma2 family endonuclease n=1 Tax=Pseudanabaena sp. FACHB-1998 TaxID=2692858 RepID=UPI001680B9C0|nr:Uma2 family endonuclease [Pseudanabaena sp. FACHB-1998]MBD2179002.1 Uma2 family endonuclease [Pseudanabaena sp. FACHB-1998]